MVRSNNRGRNHVRSFNGVEATECIGGTRLDKYNRTVLRPDGRVINLTVRLVQIARILTETGSDIGAAELRRRIQIETGEILSEPNAWHALRRTKVRLGLER